MTFRCIIIFLPFQVSRRVRVIVLRVRPVENLFLGLGSIFGLNIENNSFGFDSDSGLTPNSVVMCGSDKTRPMHDCDKRSE